MFPCFDQPDIKAKWVFEAVVSSDWTVISNDVATVSEEAADAVATKMKECADKFGSGDSWTSMSSHKHFKFNETPKISTYIYAIVAGPFDYWEDIQPDLPLMRIYARKTLKQEVNHKEMFLVT